MLELLLLFICSCASFASSVDDIVPDDLSDIHSIHLSAGQMTSSRRANSIPHLNCVSGCHFGFLPTTVDCFNLGWTGVDFAWECVSGSLMPDGISFSSVTVSCEGYNGPGDRMILPGSCGLFYSLQLSESYSPYQANDPSSFHASGFPESPNPNPESYDPSQRIDYHGPQQPGARYPYQETLPPTHPGSIHLSDVGSLRFVAGYWTQTYRSSPVPQMNCQGTLCNPDVIPVTATCDNAGWDSATQQFLWYCQAELIPEVELESVQVSCEGLASPDDLNVVFDSCALYYSLQYVPGFL